MYNSYIFGFYPQNNTVDTSTYIENSLWALTNVSMTEVVSTDRYFDADAEIQTEDLSINFVLKRKPLYFMINNIFPSMILNCVTLLAFTLPFATQIGLSIPQTYCLSNIYPDPD